ncbi:hypothetical protein DFH06DRAFT_1479129 [Mycena polygramma]|nr:hypothetical protein DFH06DRAFT_1479129 [Mycena polygramma]
MAELEPGNIWDSVLGLLVAIETVLGVTTLQYMVDWGSIKDGVQSLNSKASTATFLAAVQSQIIAISYQNNSTAFPVATNVFGFLGVLSDVIAACLALLGSTILQRHITVVEKELDHTAVANASPERLTELH